MLWHRNRALAVLALLALGGGHAAAQEDSAFAEIASARLAAYAEHELFSGSVLVARDGEILLRESFGLANREWNIPNTPDTRFRIGSITKQFTATAILQLQEAGLLSVDDPVSEYYEEAPAEWDAITIQHLLTHTSGIPSHTDDPDFWENLLRIDHTPQEVIELTQDLPLSFEPGTQFHYNNTGYVLLGYIIEKVSGQSYADYMSGHIFDPLGMDGTGYDDTRAILPLRASGYGRRQNGEIVNASFIAMSVPHAAGGLYSTVDDLLIWDQALYAGTPIGPASMEVMFTDYGHHYGFGWAVNEGYGRPYVSHNGGINGFNTGIVRFPEEKLAVIVLSNFIFIPADGIAMELAGIYFGDVQPPTAIAVDPSFFDRYVGRYSLSSDSVVTILRRGDDLYAQTGTSPEVRLSARSEVHFFIEGDVVDYIFPPNENERAVSLIHRAGIVSKLAPRIE